MKDVVLRHAFNYEQPVEEINSGEKIVEDFGYQSAEEKILGMINAGMRLKQARDEYYDYIGGDEDDEPDFDRLEDPTRRVGYDPADASDGMRRAIHRIKVRQEKKEAETKIDEPVKEKSDVVVE